MATQDAFDFGDVEDANAEGIKKAAAKKAEKEAAQQEAKEKAKKAEADYFKDQRTPKSKLIAQSELNKMKAITGGQSSMISPSGNTTAAGRGTAYAERPDNAYQKMADQQIQDSENRRAKLAELKARNASKGPSGGGAGSGTGNGAEIKMLQNPKAMKKGGKVKSASSRADGCAIRGKTRA